MFMKTTRRLAEYISEFRYSSIPDEVITVAKRAFLDTIGVMMSGVNESGPKILQELLDEEGGRPRASIIGKKTKASLLNTALMNGTLGHAIDFDDVNMSVQGHPSVVLIPAILPIAEDRAIHGSRLIASYVVGFEVMAKLGRILGFQHYYKGWHGTATLGTMGAAAAASNLIGLNTDQTSMALGIAASHVSGTRQNFGTMTKPYHPGHAARSGIIAALLAEKGFTADEAILEEKLGFFSLFEGAASDDWLEQLGNPFDLLQPGLDVKKYPCCYATHRMADAVLALRQEVEIPVQEIDHIDCTVPVGGLAPLIHDRPETGLEGKFSMQFVVSAACIDGKVTLDTFTDVLVQRPVIQELIPKIHPIEDPGMKIERSGISEGVAQLRIYLKNGTVLPKDVAVPKGASGNPLTWDELVMKYQDCARFVIITQEDIDRSVKLIEHLELQENIIPLMEILRG
jgi:2-methylcitrate dehydratase PrpD